MPKTTILARPALAFGLVLGLAAALLAPACKRGPAAPAWILAAPAGSQTSISGRLGWLMQDPGFRQLLAKSPEAEQSLDLFLQRAHIDPATDPGRLTVHLMSLPDEAKPANGLLLALDQFKDPKALQLALASSFPPEGTLRWDGRECPLHVILDVETPKLKAHLRALGDPDGRIWIGDLETLTQAASGAFGPPPELAQAAAWISPDAPLQGFFRPESLLRTWKSRAGEDLPLDLPKGIAYLAWSVTPPPEKDRPYAFEVALSGEEAAVNQATPWVQRLAAIADAVQKGQGPGPEIQSGRTWVSLRMHLTGAQVEQVLGKLGQSFVSLPPKGGGPKA